ncbi:hypothetical protein BO71DRAFT_395538 [Aspergillus ellipticus CBS 707.79]|uniref:Methyltransferase domain-containing protein n=1 Tax=Aspergillus ellipticus CBS 707.79 TaxID=1448320 RepID=A0A319DKI3_9EURO|nr:hypothetical protein BO71DRAFT_395538 [Aspergillus ellipticus CBS 707.79]
MEPILTSFLHNPTLKEKFYIPRFHHRLLIATAWSIPPGQRILDIGCGQGESCLVLAHLVAPARHITGIDIAHLEYGSPFTVAESHAYATRTSSPLGARLSFHPRMDTSKFLAGLGRPAGEVFHTVVRCHSLFYFPDECGGGVSDDGYLVGCAGVEGLLSRGKKQACILSRLDVWLLLQWGRDSQYAVVF